MKKRMYVISGVTGMTGNELARQLVSRHDYVIGFDNFFASSIDTVSDILGERYFEFYEYDINNTTQMDMLYDRVIKKMPEASKVIFINCAAVVHTEHFYDINSTFETNVISMKKSLDKAIEIGCCQYINCSTSEVYSMNSFNETGGVRESSNLLFATAETSQRTSYATGKLLTEFFMKDAVNRNLIKGCSIRFANVYSKDEKFSKHIIPHIIHSLLETGKLTLLNNSKTNRRTFLHNIDSCSAVLALSDAGDVPDKDAAYAAAPGIDVALPVGGGSDNSTRRAGVDEVLDGSIYNVATDEEISIIDLAKMIAVKMGIVDLQINFEGHRTADPERRILNTDKLRVATGWLPKVKLSNGLDMCIAHTMKSRRPMSVDEY